MIDYATEERQRFIQRSPLQPKLDAALRYLGNRWVFHHSQRIRPLNKPVEVRIDGNTVLRRSKP